MKNYHGSKRVMSMGKKLEKFTPSSNVNYQIAMGRLIFVGTLQSSLLIMRVLHTSVLGQRRHLFLLKMISKHCWKRRKKGREAASRRLNCPVNDLGNVSKSNIPNGVQLLTYSSIFQDLMGCMQKESMALFYDYLSSYDIKTRNTMNDDNVSAYKLCWKRKFIVVPCLTKKMMTRWIKNMFFGFSV